MLELKQWRERIWNEVSKAFRGDVRAVDWLLTALLAGGHVLLEDIPGVGKTLLARALATALGGDFSRVQGTPDLLPSDILGFSVYNPQDGSFTFRPGPIESFVVLIDEINRAAPRTQSALLQAMGEGEVSRDGRVIPLKDPFLVIATENPIEFEGTFPLPEAQKDRFLLSFSLGYPTRSQEESILRDLPYARFQADKVAVVSGPEEIRRLRTEVQKVFADPRIVQYVLDLAEATRQDSSLRLGISPRGAQALFQACKALALLRGRSFVLPDDVKELFLPSARTRILMKPSALARGMDADSILGQILERIPTPVLKEQGAREGT